MLNTKLRELKDGKEYPAMVPAAQLLHHAVSDLASKQAYGSDDVAYRAMYLPPDAVAQ